MSPLDDTIAAIASPPGGAARGIVRVSGPEATACIGRYFRAADMSGPLTGQGPRIVDGTLLLPGIFSPLPCEVYLWPQGRSYTGQAVAEVHTLGSPPLLQAVLRAVCAAGARLAEPGEFTLRAFLAGRIDLTQAEAVLGVIDAADGEQLSVALAQLAGGLATPLHRLRDALLELLAHLEAGFDFADEDLAFISPEQLDRQLAEAAETVARLVRQMDSRARTGAEVRAVLVGRPNTGKSSLYNTLLGRPGALVSEHPGTTRDYLTADLDLGGVTCQLVDTAGLDAVTGNAAAHAAAAADPQQAAQAVAAEQHRLAQVRILCLDSTRPLDQWEREELAQERPSDDLGTVPIFARPCFAWCPKWDGPPSTPPSMRIIVLTKCDAPRQMDLVDQAIETSSVTGTGVDLLRSALRRALLEATSAPSEVVAGTAVRCAESLRLSAACLGRARELVQSQEGEELVAAEIRVALNELGSVVGAVYTDDVLDRIFSRFCVGK